MDVKDSKDGYEYVKFLYNLFTLKDAELRKNHKFDKLPCYFLVKKAYGPKSETCHQIIIKGIWRDTSLAENMPNLYSYYQEFFEFVENRIKILTLPVSYYNYIKFKFTKIKEDKFCCLGLTLSQIEEKNHVSLCIQNINLMNKEDKPVKDYEKLENYFNKEMDDLYFKEEEELLELYFDLGLHLSLPDQLNICAYLDILERLLGKKYLKSLQSEGKEKYLDDISILYQKSSNKVFSIYSNNSEGF